MRTLRKFSVSRRAQSDLRAIAKYTVEKWGAEQAITYIKGLEACFKMLGERPRMGRACDEVSSGLHRHELGRHVMFYRARPGQIRIVRVLHQQMIPTKSQFER